MNLIQPVFRGAVRGFGTVSPTLAATALLPVFMRVGPPRAVAAHDRSTMDRAVRSVVTVSGIDGAGVDAVVYEWGSGGRTVALAHGWQGRASQFATLVRDLVADGYRVVAFDAPAHGESAGRHTYLFDWVDVLRIVEAHHGRLHAIVGHSFGGLAAAVAVAQDVGARDIGAQRVRADRIVMIAAPVDADSLLREFGRVVGAGRRTIDALRTRFAGRFFGDVEALTRISAVTGRLAGTDLLVIHDVGDRRVPHDDARRIAEAHPDARLLSTRGHGHTRILGADEPLDAILAFLGEAPPARPMLDVRRDGMPRPRPRVPSTS